MGGQRATGSAAEADEDSGKVLGDIPGQKTAHGVAIVPKVGRGFITDGGGSGSTAGVAIYFDGVAAAASVVVDTLTFSTASGLPVRFGMRNDAFDPLSGPMAFGRIYGTELTAAQVATLFGLGPQ